jgi:ribosomal protein L10
MIAGNPHGAARIPAQKEHAVADLAERLGRMRSAVLTDYRGLTVDQLESLRSSLRGAGVRLLGGQEHPGQAG